MKKPSAEAKLSNPQAERIIIGKLIQDTTLFLGVSESLHAFHFSVPIFERIYGCMREIVFDGKKPTLSLLQMRVGPEYDDGASTMTLMTSLARDAHEIEDIGREILEVVELWQRRRLLELCQYAASEAKKKDTDMSYLLGDMEHAFKDISVNSQADPLQTMGEITRNAVTKSAKTNKTGVSPGFDTGLSSLDEILGRIHPGDFGFICARQGDAKTVLGVQLANHAQGILPTIIFELEMRKQDLANRALAAQSDISVSQIEEGNYELFQLEELRAAQAAFEHSRCYVDDRPKLRIDQIYDRCMAIKRTKGLGLVVIDHLRLVRATGKYNNKFDRVEYVTGEMKAMAKDLDIAVIALSQVTRSSQRRDDPFPQLTDTDGGASIEQDADWALGMFRRDRWLRSNKPLNMDTSEGKQWAEDIQRWNGKIEIGTLKRRRGQDGEKREFNFLGKRGLIAELER